MTLEPRLLKNALWCVGQEFDARKRDKRVSRTGWEAELIRALELEIRTTEDGSATAATGADSKATEKLIGSRQAANILRCTPRYIRDIAEQELGGVWCEGRWVFDEQVVRNYAERRRVDRAARFAVRRGGHPDGNERWRVRRAHGES